ncbi:NAD(P)/FAD-dependent oxidoreductase [Ktedonospora formicarum]|uniref:FAD/NAD(P)-binding domain-containing protein n=1 Tax=Ktedonospora formicarum TaxID=2778364 RepID=A0A8J3HXD1_9CHLR|nr:NAD(P)/FAD-dependent oxidoreductase [Ktedonospora formicarum]GHO42397.1 hypothetical protein KSX_05600 [Ktedonospora formicarum]
MIFDCAIIGGGPAGLSAALVLGRARRHVVVFDDDKPRNAVTQHSHGFLTRDGVQPAEFRALGRQDIAAYPSVAFHAARIESARKLETTFEVVTDSGEIFESRTLLLTTGIQETLPAIDGIYDYYGKSLFNCPYCDGWELRDQPLVIITEQEMGASHVPQLLYNWSQDIVVCTNGHHILKEEQKLFFEKYGIQVVEEKIAALVGQSGQLERIEFVNHPGIERTGGIVGVQWRHATTLGQDLGCATNAMGGIAVDEQGRTNIKGVYAAGDTVTILMQAQVLLASASGSKAAFGITNELISSYFA